MAGFIYIRGKREPIKVEADRARKIKLARFGDRDGNGKMEPNELVDLGDEWAGELGQIRTVEIEKDAPKAAPLPDPTIEREEARKAMLALTIQERWGKEVFRFNMRWWSRSGMKEKNAPEAVLAEARKMALAWWKDHSNEPYLDMGAVEPVLVKYWGTKQPKGLADSMRVVHREGE